MKPQEIAELFSSHRFDDVVDRLAPTVRWVIPGQDTVEGSAAVAAVCLQTSSELADLERVEVVRFVSVGDERVAAVDAVARYVGRDGSLSVVSSADIYEFDVDGRVAAITSYAVELPG